ncbi:MAG: metallophosphoesterase [Deltaproteobacteria bacterium]|nr:metallophosphoesterase [Deltaproteobacteria bacterium]
MARPLLFVGDVHLGRRPTGLDGALPHGLELEALSPTAALRATVDLALERKVRAVVFAGDLIDDAEDRFEAIRPLEEAVRRLGAAGISVFGVAGNHDTLALPRLAGRIEGFTLLGEGGRWQLEAIPPIDEGDPPLDLLGWSFPESHVLEDPTAELEGSGILAARRPGARLLGVLHGDLLDAGSRYAPLSRHRLAALGADAFLLGHIHRPDALTGERPLGYLGSLCALDAGETGPHGPWLLHLEGETRLEQVPLSPLRYEAITLALEEASARTPDALLAAIRARLPEGELDPRHTRLVVVRATLEGRLSDRQAVRELAALSVGERQLGGEIPGLVERVDDRTRPALDLQHLAERPTPVGHLARRILALQEGDEAARAALLADARARCHDWLSGRWALPPGASLAPPLEDRLLPAAWAALEALLEHSSEGAG